MTFLHLIMLAGLVLVAAPVVIHLLNRLRYRTVRWAAIQFLIRANRNAARRARLRQILLLLCRMLILLGLILAMTRPMVGGWLGWRSPLQSTALKVLQSDVRGDAGRPPRAGQGGRLGDEARDVLPHRQHPRHAVARLLEAVDVERCERGGTGEGFAGDRDDGEGRLLGVRAGMTPVLLVESFKVD